MRLDVSTEPDFATTVARVRLNALPLYDFTVRAKVTGLRPTTTYYYRFVANGDVSVVGMARTAPGPTDANPQVRFAWFTCQDWKVNHWQAMALMAAEPDLDFVVHVGDYIYETVGGPIADPQEVAHTPIRLPDGGVCANTLEDYRTLYRTYRSDDRLQALHRQVAMIAIWDDHEFSDDCWQDHQAYTNEAKQETQRRRNANQAWAEYMPIDWGDVDFRPDDASYTNIRIYRDVTFGSLMQLITTGERLYRDGPVVSARTYAEDPHHDPVSGDDAAGSRYFVNLPLLKRSEEQDTARLGRAPSMLGPVQTQWWKNTLKASRATWKVWGNEVMLNRLWAQLRQTNPKADEVVVIDCDSWDGYPAHKHELLAFLKQESIRNVIAITGDLHAFQCGIVRDVAAPAAGTPVVVDFVCAGISSTSLYTYVRAAWHKTPLAPLVATPVAFDSFIRVNNPDLRYVDHDAQGYASATVTSERFSVVFNKVKRLNSDGSTPDLPLLHRTRLTVFRDSAEVRVD
ncbi:alkaline phosphatase D family protein [Paraburkholderia hospita]|uniref:alkaline phosphatase D family protein n=1 Tax=Paraburkholderia hospita TaxID=169430 RepID=UPI0008A75C30|nr:alkaline phosphatase D family protein [Paraburkholderia hospita]SEI22020.1 alkaline phosphatase D [Paraburkholderia hospita]